MSRLRVSAICAVLAGAACGDNLAKLSPDAPTATCGNLIVEPGEDCDDGDTTTDAVCDATCHFTCGNGVVDVDLGEMCDTGIASGDGACPTSCDDGQACTTDVLSGSACTATCVHTDITTPVDGDACCPSGANANTDTDCPAECGNGIVEPGEACDTGIIAGAGACPTSCDDQQ
jgi:cysteine-rich repeat protein